MKISSVAALPRTAALALSLVAALCTPARSQPVDPGLPGPHTVADAEYDFGDMFFPANTLAAFPGPIEFRAAVHYPSDLSSGPFPLLVFLHGRHATCFFGTSAALQWPCGSGRSPIPSYRGYDYAAELLASHGFIVVSVSANGINARDNSVADLGMLARAQLLQQHLDLWNTFNTTGAAPFGTQFVGEVDLTRVGTMGHSRGGEGVARHVLFNAAQPSPYGVLAVLPLAPTDFNRFIPTSVELAVHLPYCDGDVADLQGMHFFDDARYAMAGDPAAKYTVLFMGANHNYFNTVWTPGLFPAGTADDWTAFVSGGLLDRHCGPTAPGNARLTPAQQRAAGAAYLSGFFRTHVIGEGGFESLLRGDRAAPPSALTTDLVVSYHPPDDPLLRRDVNRLLTDANLTTNTLGGSVTQIGLTPFDLCGGPIPQPQHCIVASNARQPHTTPSARSSARGLSQLRFGWDGPTASYVNAIPPGSSDVSHFATLQFRAALNPQDGRNSPGVPQDFLVVLADSAGRSASTPVSTWSRSLSYPRGSFPGTHLPKLILNTVRVPISAFTGIDLTDVRTIEFTFDRKDPGAVLVTDIAFADEAAAPPPPIDTTPPTTSATPSPGPNGNGWNNTDVIIALSAIDDEGGSGVKEIVVSLSGVQTATFVTAGATASASLPAEGVTTVTYFARDNDGNEESPQTLTVQVDKTAPIISAARSGPPNANGWYITNVTVTFTATDALSGVGSVTPPITLIAEGVGQSATGTVVDLAGNTASITDGDINIDKTAPIVILGAQMPPANAAGWNNTAISIPFTASDSLSGIAATSQTSPLLFTADGAGQTAPIIVTDRAGNQSEVMAGPVNIDRSAPVLICAPTIPGQRWPPDHQLSLVGATVTVTDTLSGGGAFVLASATSNEPDNGTGDGDLPDDIQGFVVGTPDTQGMVRSERSGSGTGRVYTLTFEGRDNAGNVAACDVTAIVPHDQRR